MPPIPPPLRPPILDRIYVQTDYKLNMNSLLKIALVILLKHSSNSVCNTDTINLTGDTRIHGYWVQHQIYTEFRFYE